MKTKSFSNKFLLVVIFLITKVFSGSSNTIEQFDNEVHPVIIEEIAFSRLSDNNLESSDVFMNIIGSDQNEIIGNKPKSKAIAITLAVTLGVFGVHRLYLGTSTKVPIIYTITLGGGFGVLVLSDIIAIIVTKDLEEYSSEPKVFMWAK